MEELIYGNRSMITCVICYLAWWIITFKPPAPKGTLTGSLFLIGAFIFGIGGIFLIAHAMIRLMEREIINPFIPMWIIPVAGILFYVILLVLSSGLLHRPVTSELLIIIIWTVLEICFVGTMYRYGFIENGVLSALIAGIIIVTIISMICYLLYYKLEYVKGYYDGMVPLMLTGIMMAVINMACRKGI
ncbi:MAG: hypothetical protein K5770_02910 [Lachnospiraceae bacterium]|nr:hypothetical protein [Lachnospiraceae bacterium]